MQKRQGYCSYCRVQYANLEQHLFSAQHRSLTRQSRRRICPNSLMERFLQDVLRHHPYNYQDSRSAQNEAPAANPGSPDLVVLDEFIPEEKDEDTTDSSEEMYSDDSESDEELDCGPINSQECADEFSIRPSVIQKLEKGQQQSLPFVHNIESGMKKINPVEIGQATNNGKKLIRPPVICNAPASRLSKSSYQRPLAAKTTRLALAVSSESLSPCYLNSEPFFDQLDEASGSSNPGTSSEKPKESNKKSVCINLDKWLSQKNAKSKGESLTPVFKFREIKSTEGSVSVVSVESSSESAANSAKLNKTDIPSDKGISADAIPEHHEESFSNTDCTPKEKQPDLNKPATLKQKCSVNSERKFDHGSLESTSDQFQKAVQGLKLSNEDRVDQEDENYEARASEMSFDCGSSCHSLTALSELTAREINLSEEIPAEVQDKNNKSGFSKTAAGGVCIDSVEVVTSQSQVIDKEISRQNTKRVSLVDESYDSSGSEMNFDSGDSLQSTNDYPQKPEKEGSLPKKVHIELVDRSYGSSSSEVSDDFSLDEPPVVVTEIKCRKKAHISLVDESYGSSFSEASSDSDASLDHPQMTVKERNLKDRPVHLKNKKRKPSGAKAHLDCDVSLETVTDEPQRDIEEVNLLKEKNADLVDMNCESHGPEMGFHADAQLVADQSQVAVKEVNPQKVDIDLEIESIRFSISNLSFDSHAFLYQSANDQPQGALGEVNLKELNVDMEVKSNGCSSSELTFDSDSPLLSVTELDVERIKEDHINLEDESCESSSSDITFDSDIPNFSVVDQPEVADYEEEPVDLENKSNESCISEITFDSDIPLHSGNDPPEVAVEVIIQEEEYVHLERKNDIPSDCEINLDFYASLPSVTNPPEVTVKKQNSQKEEQVHVKIKENMPADSELSLDYIFHSNPGHSEDPVKDINFQQEEHIHLENKSNELNVSETGLDSDTSIHSVIYKPQVVVKNIWLQKEKHAELQSKSAEFNGSVINSGSRVLHYPVTEPQRAGKKAKRKTKHIVEEKSDKYGASELILNSDVLPQLITQKPQLAVLKEGHADPEDESTQLRGFEMNLNIDGFLHSVTDQPHLAFWKEKHVDLKDRNSKPSDSKISFNSVDSLQSLSKQHHKAITKINLWKEEAIGLKNKISEPNGSKVTHDSDVFFQSVADQTEVAVKQINLENEDQMYLETKSSQYSCSETSFDSDFLVQSRVNQPKITILESKHIEQESKCNQSCDSEVFDSGECLQSVTESQRTGKKAKRKKKHILEYDQLSDTRKEMDLWKNENIDVEGEQDEAKGFQITYDSDVLQPVAGQTEVAQETNLWKQHVNLEDKSVKPSDSKINFDSDDPFQSVISKIQEPVKEINLLREGHAYMDDKGYEPCGSGIIYVPSTPFCSVIQQPQILQEGHANLEIQSSDPCGREKAFDSNDPCHSSDPCGRKITFDSSDPCHSSDPCSHEITFDSNGPCHSSDPCSHEITFDSNDPCCSAADQLQKAIKEMNLKEDHIYLEDKSYRLVDFEASYDSDVPVQLVVDPSVEDVSDKEINLQKEDHNDLENKNYEPHCSEIRYDSGVHLQAEIEPPQVTCSETNLQERELLDMEEKSNEPSDSEMMYDSDVSFQIVVNQVQTSDGEADSPQVVFVDVAASDSDCDREVISDSNVPLQPVTDPPQMTVKDTSPANSVRYCEFCGCKLRNDYAAFPQSVINQSKESFRIINRKNDYIILGDTTCQSCGYEINFNVKVSDQSMSYQSQGPDQNCVDSEEKRNFNLEDTSQPVTHQLQKADEVNLWRGLKNTDLQDKSWESGVPVVDRAAFAVSVIQHTSNIVNPLNLKCPDLQSTSYKSYGSEMNFQNDPSHQSNTDQPQEAVKKIRRRKKVTFDLREQIYTYPSSPVPMVDSVRNLEEAREFADDPNEPVFEGLPYVPPPFMENTWSQKTREDDIEINTLMEGFTEGHSHCYFDDDSETKKVFLNEEEKTTWSDFNQDAASIQALSEVVEGRIADIDNFSVALDKPSSHFSPAEGLHQQNWHVTSQSQTVKANPGTQPSFMNYPLKKRKINIQEEESPKKKYLQNDSKEKKKPKIGTVEFPIPQAKVLDPVQSGSLVCVPSLNTEPKISESFNAPKMKHCNCDNDLQFVCTCNNPLLMKTVINSPQNLVVPDFDRHERVDIDFNRSDLSANAGESGGNMQNLAPTSFMTIPARYELRSRHRISESYAFLENSEYANASEVPKDSIFQPTLLNTDAAKISPKSVRSEFLGNKNKKIRRRKVATRNKSRLSRNRSKAVTALQNSALISEKLTIWVLMKASGVIKKYISRDSVFMHRRCQHRVSLLGNHLKKKISLANRIKKMKRAAKMLWKSSVPSVGAEEHLRAIAGPSPKQPVQHPSSAEARKKHDNRSYPRRKKKPAPVREYDLRSSCFIPDSDRMVTRLASKLRGNEVK
ncbi:DBF4-type zinc finger-containing protein 2 isoform X2 [Castor canadensis]|uniref:DBF4-type zinc finger-containing protein 2 isoform X2 n=1 Tax=Castor canadensis TaxID=51338 RepID=A0AC58ME19_CASCN